MNTPGTGARAWAGLAAGLAVAALLAAALPRQTIDWQPALAFAEPWRAFSAAAVHYSPLHLAANLAGTLLVGLLGVVAELPARCAWAWFAAWPLTHFGLLLRPELAHYGGLSGVLHAGVAVAALHLIVRGTARRRGIGAAILTGLLAKVLSEGPWGPVLQVREGWDIAVAPLAHATGTLAGLLCALVCLLAAAPRPAQPHD